MRKLTTAVGAVLLLLVLAGCIRFQADLTISANDTVSGDLVVAVIVNDEAEDGERVAAQRALELEASLVPALSGSVGVTRSEYTDDGYIGSRFELRDTPLSAFADVGNAEALTIVRSGDRIVLSGAIDVTDAGEAGAEEPVDPDAEASGDISVRVTFPGEVLSHDGQQNGRTVTWTTEFDRPITLNAESEVDTGPDLTLLWAGMIVALLLVVAILILVLVLRRRRRRGSAQQTEAPPA